MCDWEPCVAAVWAGLHDMHFRRYCSGKAAFEHLTSPWVKRILATASWTSCRFCFVFSLIATTRIEFLKGMGMPQTQSWVLWNVQTDHGSRPVRSKAWLVSGTRLVREGHFFFFFKLSKRESGCCDSFDRFHLWYDFLNLGVEPSACTGSVWVLVGSFLHSCQNW